MAEIDLGTRLARKGVDVPGGLVVFKLTSGKNAVIPAMEGRYPGPGEASLPRQMPHFRVRHDGDSFIFQGAGTAFMTIRLEMPSRRGATSIDI